MIASYMRIIHREEQDMHISEIAAKDSQKSFMTLHEDPQKLHIGTLPDHNYYIPFAKGQDAFAVREESDRFELLNGLMVFRENVLTSKETSNEAIYC
jgi:hypothetical protein